MLWRKEVLVHILGVQGKASSFEKSLLNSIMSDELTSILFLFLYGHPWFALIKLLYSNVLSSSHFLQMLLPFQEASLIVNVSVFRARMVLDPLEADSDSSHGVKFIFLMPDSFHAPQNFSGLFVVVVVVVSMVSSLVSRSALNKAVTCVNLTFVTNKRLFLTHFSTTS